MKITLIILMTTLTGCSIVPTYELQQVSYCDRREYDKTCRGYGNQETNVEWLMKESRRNQR